MNPFQNPKDVIGHNIGDWHVTHDKLVHYMYTLADVSDRISIENKDLPMKTDRLYFLLSPQKENHNNISEIQSSHKKLQILIKILS